MFRSPVATNLWTRRRLAIAPKGILSFLVCSRHHRDECAPALAFPELDAAIHHREQRVILAHADMAAGIPARAALPDDDVAGKDVFAAKLLDPESLALRVAAIAR
jgi:hypothetical protein